MVFITLLPMLQAMRALKEPAILVRCRQVDLVMVRELLEPARKQFASQHKEDAPLLTLDQSSFLPPPPQTGKEEGETRWGTKTCGRAWGGRLP